MPLFSRLQSDLERNQFVVTLLFRHFESLDDWVWLRSFQDVEFSDEQARAFRQRCGGFISRSPGAAYWRTVVSRGKERLHL
jgi:hypothetical protein